MKRCCALLSLLLAATGAVAASPNPADQKNPAAAEAPAQAAVNELQTIDRKIGSGAAAEPGKQAVVHSTGWLYDPAAEDKKGRKFDSSRDGNEPFTFLLGAGKVIKGWDQGVAGMKVGGERTLIIPAELAYGSKGAGSVIPPDAALLFDVELLAVK
jgi:FKBP-type peptidyl-prolyl cis-trans isomerase FkpA